MHDLWNFLLAYFAPIFGTAIGLISIVVWAALFRGFEWLTDRLEEVLDKLDDLF